MDIHHIFLFAVAAPDDPISIQEKSFFQAAAAAEKDHLCLKIKLGDSRAAVLIFLVILQQLEGNLIYPKVVGSSLGLPAIWVLAAVTIGGGIMGIGGMLLGVPIAAALYRLLKEDLNGTRDVL